MKLRVKIAIWLRQCKLPKVKIGYRKDAPFIPKEFNDKTHTKR